MICAIELASPKPTGQHHDRLALAVNFVVDSQAFGGRGVACADGESLSAVPFRGLTSERLETISDKTAAEEIICSMERGMIVALLKLFGVASDPSL